jgi:hypothetical protein
MTHERQCRHGECARLYVKNIHDSMLSHVGMCECVHVGIWPQLRLLLRGSLASSACMCTSYNNHDDDDNNYSKNNNNNSNNKKRVMALLQRFCKRVSEEHMAVPTASPSYQNAGDANLSQRLCRRTVVSGDGSDGIDELVMRFPFAAERPLPCRGFD